MICHNDIERGYIDLYTQLRNYIWSYDFVECLACLEDEVFNRFPDMKSMRSIFNKLYNLCYNTRKDNPDLEDNLLKFKNLIESDDCDYSYLVINMAQ